VRVVDYKTGQKDFSLYDISLGLNLQMLLYLFSIWKDETGAFRRAVSCSGDIIPSGVLYCTAKPSEITVAGDLTDEQIYAKVEDTLKRKGLLLNDEEVLRMMEKKLDGKYIPVTLKKDGSLSTSLTLESLEGLGKLMDDIMTTISRLAGEMKSGVATCRPLKDAKHDACRFCPHKPVCRNPSALS
jgi:ATP-dependent helicase/nuclease subunit B